MNELRIDPLLFPFLERLAPGVVGYTVDDGDELWVPVIQAETEGAGDVGRYLDSLSGDRTCVVPNVINPRLQGMLHRRGFVEEPHPVDGDVITVWRRRA